MVTHNTIHAEFHAIKFHLLCPWLHIISFTAFKGLKSMAGVIQLGFRRIRLVTNNQTNFMRSLEDAIVRTPKRLCMSYLREWTNIHIIKE